MMKYYFIFLVVCSLGVAGFAQDTLNLLPPANLQADFENDVVLLSWTAPVDTSATPDTIPQGLIGYNVYSATELIGFTQHPVVTYTDCTPDPDVAFYRITALYDLAFYGYPGDTAESEFSGSAYAITGYSYVLPFSEYFLTGVFETNQWVPESSNWRIAGQSGNPAPSAEFYTSPPDSNYSFSLISTWLGGSYTDGNIYVSFSLKSMIVNPTLTEHLYLDVFNGFEWQMVAAFINDANTGWNDYDINLPDEFILAPFKIRFRAEGQNSMNIVYWQTDNIIVYRKCAAPYDLVLSIPNPMTQGCMILLEWEDPESPSTISDWLHWDSGENADAIGLTGGGTFLVASRFTQAHLIPFINTYLTKIRMYPYSPGGEIVLKVWSGANAAQLVRSQPVVSYVTGEWNEFILNEPFFITGLEELWFGYEITHGSQFVAGVDNGPAIAGYGDLISLNGSVWESMSNTYNLDYNWNLAGFVTNTPSAGEAAGSRSLVNYNIYREDSLYAATTDRFFWDDLNSYPHQSFCYKVSAVYSDCESAYSNIACNVWCWESVNDQDIPTISIYPNPASEYISVSLTGDIRQLYIVDLTGRDLATYTIPEGSTTYTADISALPKGIYIVRFVSGDGQSGGRKLVLSGE